MPVIENQLSECEVAIDKVRDFWYRPEESRVIFMMKIWTNMSIYCNNMLNVKNSLKEMAFINETEERKGLVF